MYKRARVKVVCFVKEKKKKKEGSLIGVCNGHVPSSLLCDYDVEVGC